MVFNHNSRSYSNSMFLCSGDLIVTHRSHLHYSAEEPMPVLSRTYSSTSKSYLSREVWIEDTTEYLETFYGQSVSNVSEDENYITFYNGCIDKKLDTLASKEACVTKTYENANTCHATEGLAL